MDLSSSKTFSPRDVARAVGVSVSSIKRWVDDGDVEVTRTRGGHRRFTLPALLHFVRASGLPLVRPEVLGLPELAPTAEDAAGTAAEVFAARLEAGQGAAAYGVLARRYLAGDTLAELFDGPVAQAMREVGTLWHHDERGIYLEHQATSLCLEAVTRLRMLLAPASPRAPLALGGAPSGDPYLLPSTMVAAVQASAGWRTVNLGPNTPAVAFRHAVAAHRPRLVWLALHAPLDDAAATALSADLLEPLLADGPSVVLGGPAAQAACAHWPDPVHVLDSMAALERFLAAEGRVLGRR